MAVVAFSSGGQAALAFHTRPAMMARPTPHPFMSRVEAGADALEDIAIPEVIESHSLFETPYLGRMWRGAGEDQPSRRQMVDLSFRPRRRS